MKVFPILIFSLLMLCRRYENAFFLILNTSPALALNKEKGLSFLHRVNFIKNLRELVN